MEGYQALNIDAKNSVQDIVGLKILGIVLLVLSLVATAFWFGRAVIYPEAYAMVWLDVGVYIFSAVVLICELLYLCIRPTHEFRKSTGYLLR
jgi:hypothetical protein